MAKMHRNRRQQRKEFANDLGFTPEQWLAEQTESDLRDTWAAFVTTFYPGCEVRMMELTVPTEDVAGLRRVHCHLVSDSGVFTLTGQGSTLRSALLDAIHDGLQEMSQP